MINLFSRVEYYFHRQRDLQNRVSQLEAYLGYLAAENSDVCPTQLDLHPGPLPGRWRPLGGTEGSGSWEKMAAKRARDRCA